MTIKVLLAVNQPESRRGPLHGRVAGSPVRLIATVASGSLVRESSTATSGGSVFTSEDGPAANTVLVFAALVATVQR